MVEVSKNLIWLPLGPTTLVGGCTYVRWVAANGNNGQLMEPGADAHAYAPGAMGPGAAVPFSAAVLRAPVFVASLIQKPLGVLHEEAQSDRGD